jgi:hypothetical protein
MKSLLGSATKAFLKNVFKSWKVLKKSFIVTKGMKIQDFFWMKSQMSITGYKNWDEEIKIG